MLNGDVAMKLIFKKNIEKNDKENIIKIKNGIIGYSSNTLSQEKEREKILYQTANSINTVISILLVAVMTLIFELLDRLEEIDYLIVIFGTILCFILMLSLIFSITAHWFYKKEYTKSGTEFINYINEHRDKYDTEEGFLDQKISDIDQMYFSLEKNNNLRLKYLIASLILLYIFFALVFIFGIVILIVAI